MATVAENLKNIMLNDLAYFKSWYDFYFNIEKFLSEERKKEAIAPYKSDIFAALLQSEYAKTTVRRQLLQNLGLSLQVDFDIDSPAMKIAINDKKFLKRGMIIAGSIFCYEEIAKVIVKKNLTKLIDFIGEHIYSFIIKRVMVLRKMVPAIAHSHEASIISKIASSGKNILCHALVGLPNEAKKRLELILEEEFVIPSGTNDAIIKQCRDLIQFSITKSKHEKPKE